MNSDKKADEKTSTEKNVTKAKVTSERSANKVQVMVPRIYIGPTIAGVAKNNQVFKGGVIPKPLDEMAKEVPSIRGLIIPVSELGKANKQLRTENSALYVFYEKARNVIRKGE